MINEINNFSSKSKASDIAVMIGAYDPATGKIAVGRSNAKITADALDERTVNYIESKLNVKIGEFTSFCKNKVGACAEISAADQLIRQGADPSSIRFTQAVRPQHVYGKDRMPEKDSRANIETCSNCKVTWPKGD